MQMCAAAVGGNVRVLQQYAAGDESGVLNEANYDEQTPLMLAAIHGQLQTAELLVAAGADSRVRDRNGDNAMVLAQRHWHLEIVALLQQHIAGAKALIRIDSFFEAKSSVHASWKLQDLRAVIVCRAARFTPASSITHAR
jgi:hypothetical protein